MDTKRGAIVVGASLAALTAGIFLRRFLAKREHLEEERSARLVDKFDQRMKELNQTRRKSRSTHSNGHAKTSA